MIHDVTFKLHEMIHDVASKPGCLFILPQYMWKIAEMI